jgi:hypothetical protein
VDGQMDPSLAIVLKGLQCMLCGESWGAITRCWFVTIILEVGILVVWHHHFWRFPLEIGCVYYAPNKHVLLFHVRPLYWDIGMFLIGTLGDFKKVNFGWTWIIVARWLMMGFTSHPT